MHCLTVVGARPNFIKLWALHDAFRKRDAIRHTIIHTGQHYDPEMNARFFQELEIPAPDVNLNVRADSQAEQVARAMLALDPVLAEARPDWVLAVGDANPALAAGLVSKKLDLPLAHVEAGLRSGDWAMPEEINRVTVDRISDILFVSDPSGMKHLAADGIPADRVHYVGNVMIDTLLAHMDWIEARTIRESLDLEAGGYAVVTLHRPSNVDDPKRLRRWLEMLAALAERLPLVFPLHPRTRSRIDALSDAPRPEGVRMIEPLGYLDMLALLREARLVLTDSGGIQEETTVLGVPCLTLRENTERPVTVEQGTNRLAGVRPDAVLPLCDEALAAPADPRRPEGWDGGAGGRIADILLAT